MNAAAPPSTARTLEYPFSSKPALGETIEVAPGVLWIRMTLPYTLNHINLWALEDGDGWAIVDTGVRDKETTDAWRKIFANGFGGRGTCWRLDLDHKIAGWLVGGEIIDVDRQFAVARDGDQLERVRQRLRTRRAGNGDGRRRSAVIVPLVGES